MTNPDVRKRSSITRRSLISSAAIGGAGLASTIAFAKDFIRPAKPANSTQPLLTRKFPQKGEMILQRVRPPLLETPMEVFNQGVITPNDRFYVRWHWGVIPEEIDAAAFRLKVHGHVEREIELSLDELLHGFEHIEYVAVNQCSGNSRGKFDPPVSGAQWNHGAMGNARWRGVRLRDVLDRAGVRSGAIDVRFGGLDEAMVAEAPKFRKSLSADHSRDGEVMIAFAMNGEQLPLLNGFPLRLVVPGWYSTYWVKMLNDIEVLAAKDDNFWMAAAYKVPATPFGNVSQGTTEFPKEPISRMVPRSFITNLSDGQQVPTGRPLRISGIAMGGDCGVAKVEVSIDGGKLWQTAQLGPDEGKYSFRRFELTIPALPKGQVAIGCRCTNTSGISQPLEMNWNPNGYMRAGVETVTVIAGEVK